MSKICGFFVGCDKWSLLAWLLGSGFLYLAASNVWQKVFLPDPFYVDLPEFKGRVLPAEKVKPGTFTVMESFESIKHWGDDGILSYGTPNNKDDGFASHHWRQLKLIAWRPDPKTQGVFQYAEKTFPLPPEWGFWHSATAVELQGSSLKVPPGMCGHFAGNIFLGIFCAALLFLVGSVLNPALHEWADKKE